VLLSMLIAMPIFSAPVQAAWQPSKPVEFVVPWAAGGGSDVIARTVTAIAGEEKLAPVPLVVVNKVGGSAMTGLTYVLGKKGDPHTLSFVAWTNLVAPIMEKLPFRVTDLTPIARYLLDEQLYCVQASSPYKSIRDLVSAAKKTPGAIKVGGVVIGGEDHVTNIVLENAAGIKLNYIVFRGGGDIMRELLGGHVDVAILNPSEAVAQLEAKKIRPLAVASRKRLSGMPDVPTFKEEGYDVVYESFFRGVSAAPAIPAEVAEYYVELMRRVTQTPKWQAYIKENMVTSAFMGGKEFGDYLLAQEEMGKRILTPLGLIKQ
jgi:putative tricarboxylic transport membrane protein